MKKVRKAVIPVAGMGTRFLPATKVTPKEMLPIIDKPTLQYIVEEAVNSGIEEILFITNPHKKLIEDHFDKSYELESRLEVSGKTNQLEMIRAIPKMCQIFYIRQGEPLGSGHAVSLAKNFIGNEPFAVLYGDDLMMADKPVLKQLIELYDKTGSNIIGVQNVDRNLVNRYGIIEYSNEDTKQIKRLVEKPKIEEAPSTSAGVGRYILNPEIFDELDNIKAAECGEYQLTDAMMNLMKKQVFYACEFDGKYFDIGNKLGYIKANIEFSLSRDDLKDGIKEYIQSLNK